MLKEMEYYIELDGIMILASLYVLNTTFTLCLRSKKSKESSM